MNRNLNPSSAWSKSLIPLVLVTLSAGLVARADGEEAKGGIQGTISVSGVKSPENVLVYVEEVAGEWEPTKDAHVDQIKLVFIPHVRPVVKGTTVTFKNSDPILHNIFWPKSASYAGRNLGTWGKGAEKSFTFDKLGDVVLLCNVHSEMEGHVVVLQNPFFAVVGAEGKYEIKDVPPGEYTLKTWYSNPKKLRPQSAKVTVKASEATTHDFSLDRK